MTIIVKNDITNVQVSDSAAARADRILAEQAAARAAQLVPVDGYAVSVKSFGAKGDGATNDRLAIIAAFNAMKAAGGGRLIFPPGTYVVNGHQGTYTVPELNTTYTAYDASPYSVQIYVENLTNTTVIFDGAKIKSTQTGGGYCLVFDGCSNCRFDDIELDGMLGTNDYSDHFSPMAPNGIGIWSNNYTSDRMCFHNTKISNHYGCIDIAGDPYSSTVVQNASFTGLTRMENCKYTFLCRGTGIGVYLEQAYVHLCMRPLFLYDTRDVHVNIIADTVRRGFSAIIGANTTSIKRITGQLVVKNKVVDTGPGGFDTAALEFNVQHNPTTHPTPFTISDVDLAYYELSSSPGSNYSVAFNYYQNETLQSSTTNTLFQNIKLTGTVQGRIYTNTVMTAPSACNIDLTNFVSLGGNVSFLTERGFYQNPAPASSRNLIINGGMTINQRGVTMSAASVGSYGLDRWKKTGVSTMTQIIEEGIYKPTTVYTLSGVRVATQQLTSPSSGNWTLPNIPTNSYYVQLEEGPVATPYMARSITDELALCQRFYQKSYDRDIAPGVAVPNGIIEMVVGTATTGPLYVTVKFPTPMRAQPTVTLYDQAGTSGKVTKGADGKTAVVNNRGENGFEGGTVDATSSTSVSFHYVAEAEL